MAVAIIDATVDAPKPLLQPLLRIVLLDSNLQRYEAEFLSYTILSGAHD